MAIRTPRELEDKSGVYKLSDSEEEVSQIHSPTKIASSIGRCNTSTKSFRGSFDLQRRAARRKVGSSYFTLLY